MEAQPIYYIGKVWWTDDLKHHLVIIKVMDACSASVQSLLLVIQYTVQHKLEWTPAVETVSLLLFIRDMLLYPEGLSGILESNVAQTYQLYRFPPLNILLNLSMFCKLVYPCRIFINL